MRSLGPLPSRNQKAALDGASPALTGGRVGPSEGTSFPLVARWLSWAQLGAAVAVVVGSGGAGGGVASAGGDGSDSIFGAGTLARTITGVPEPQAV